MRIKNMMTPGTLKTILNTAPMIIQGASKLIELIRDRDKEANEGEISNPDTLVEMKQEITRIETRLNENSRSDVEQIRLIEQLAQQNEALAETLRQTMRRVTVFGILAVVALIGSVCAFILSL